MTGSMRAMVLDKPKQSLQLRDMPKPKPGRGQLLVRVGACAVCRTDLHVVDGELPNPKLPLIRAIKLLAAWKRSVKEQIRNSMSAIALAFHGLVGPMANALIADPIGKTSAIARVLPATPSTAVTPNSPSLMHDSVFICPSITMMSKLRRCFARD